VLHETTNYNSKGHLNITHSREKGRTSSYRAYLMKDDVKVKVSNRNPKIFMPSDGVLKSSGKIDGDHATHL
jgi:hypothetical protein